MTESRGWSCLLKWITAEEEVGVGLVYQHRIDEISGTMVINAKGDRPFGYIRYNFGDKLLKQLP